MTKWRIQKRFDNLPPFLAVGTDAHCLLCGHVVKDITATNEAPDECQGCYKKETRHPLRTAFNRHLRTEGQPITEDWATWVQNPHQFPNSWHPRYVEYRKTQTQQSFKGWLDYTPDQLPDDTPIEYQLSKSGLSYQQWSNTPDNLKHHLTQDAKAQGVTVNALQQRNRGIK